MHLPFDSIFVVLTDNITLSYTTHKRCCPLTYVKSAHCIPFSETCYIFSGRASPCIRGSSSLKGGGRGVKLVFPSHHNVVTMKEIFTQISFDLLLVFQLLKNDGVTPNKPIEFVPTSCVALLRTLAHIIIWIIIRAILNHRVQLTQRNMAVYFFDLFQDMTDLDLHRF